MNILSDLCARIKSGEVTLEELSKIKEKNDHMIKLVKDSSSDEDKVIMSQLLDIRFKERSKFLERRSHIGQLCINVSDIHVRGN